MDKIPRPVSPARPRVEAAPLSLGKLTESQKKTAQDVLPLLARMAQNPSAFAQHPQDMIRIDPVRHNRTMLLEGSRGSGKTTLLVSMIDALQRRFGRLVDARYPAPDHPEGEDTWNTLLDKTVGAAVIVPVALVDLAPLPTRSSLLLLLVSSLELLVARIENGLAGGLGVQRSGLAPFYHDAEKPLDCRVHWNDLAAAVCHGWDETANRSPPRDLESYAREQMTAEQHRLDLSNKIDRFLAALQTDFCAYLHRVAAYKTSQGGNPAVLFLIAVDDADMNPGRVAELLESLRLLGHRQLAFLLTGDSELFETSLNRTCLFQLEGQRATAARTGSELRLKAEALSHQIYDKLVPPPHRFEIEEIRCNERLAVSWSEPESATSDTKQSPAKALSLREIMREQTPQILSILEVCPFLLEILPGHMRRMQNLILGITRRSQAVPADERDSPENRVLKVLWLDNASALGLKRTRKRFGDVTFTGNELRVSLRANIASRTVWTAESDPWVRSAADGIVRQLAFAKRIVPELAATRADQAIIETLTLAALLATLHSAGTVSVDPGHLGTALPLVQVQIELGSKGEVVLTQVDGSTSRTYVQLTKSIGSPLATELPAVLTLAWPGPARLPFHEQLTLWYCLAQWIGSSKLITEQQLVSSFLGLLCSFGASRSMRKQTAPLAPLADRLLPAPDRSLQDIAQDVVKLSKPTEDPNPLAAPMQSWARTGVVLLCAPEYGLSAELANKLLAALQRAFGEDAWYALRAEVARLRRDRLQTAVLNSMANRKDDEPRRKTDPLVEQLISMLDERLPDFHFHILIEEGAAGVVRRAYRDSWPVVSEATLRLLEQGSAAWLQLLRTGLRLFSSQGSDSMKLEPLMLLAWQATGQRASYAFSDDVERFARAAQELPERALSKYKQTIVGTPLSRGDLLAEGRTERTELRLTVTGIGSHKIRSADGVWSPLQEGILQLLWDEQVSSGTHAPLNINADWPGVSVRLLGEEVDLPWLAVRFRSFAAMNAVLRAWNHQIEILRRPELRQVNSALLDRLAVFYLRCCLAVLSSSPLPSNLPRLEDWKRDLRFALAHWKSMWSHDAGNTTPQVRNGLVPEELWDTVICWALPESGLSVEGVREIIEYLRTEDPKYKRIQSTLKQRTERVARAIKNQRVDGQSDWSACLAAAKRELETITAVAQGEDHPFQVWLDSTEALHPNRESK